MRGCRVLDRNVRALRGEIYLVAAGRMP